MKSMIWDHLQTLQEEFQDKFRDTGSPSYETGMERFNQPGWINEVYASPSYRRAHIDVVDARETKGLWMMHVCIFPHTSNDGPVFGFDVIAGKNKMTGAFHDFSPTVNDDHEMITHFAEVAQTLKWKRERELPDWAKAIFTDSMIAAGNVQDEAEINQLLKTISGTLDYYLNNIERFNGNADDFLCANAQNRYAHYQKQNPHTPRTMKSLGLDESDVDVFVKECLFPEIDVLGLQQFTERQKRS